MAIPFENSVLSMYINKRGMLDAMMGRKSKEGLCDICGELPLLIYPEVVDGETLMLCGVCVGDLEE